MHKRFNSLFEANDESLKEYRETIANECYDEHKESPTEFIECLRQKQDVIGQVPDKINAFRSFALLKSKAAAKNWESSRETISEARSSIAEALKGILSAKEEGSEDAGEEAEEEE